MNGTRRAEQRRGVLPLPDASMMSLSRTQRSLNQADMWHGVATAWAHKYMSCGLRWFKTGRMWH